MTAVEHGSETMAAVEAGMQEEKPVVSVCVLLDTRRFTMPQRLVAPTALGIVTYFNPVNNPFRRYALYYLDNVKLLL